MECTQDSAGTRKRKEMMGMLDCRGGRESSLGERVRDVRDAKKGSGEVRRGRRGWRGREEGVVRSWGGLGRKGRKGQAGVGGKRIGVGGGVELAAEGWMARRVASWRS